MRNLARVIDDIIAIAPDLEPHLHDTRESAICTEPEIMHGVWRAAADALNKHAINHPKSDDIRRIFAGETEGDEHGQ